MFKIFDFEKARKKRIGLSMILQTCLASKDWLKMVRSLNPIPPELLESFIMFQAFQCNLLPLSVVPHRKLAHKASISLLMDTDILKQDMA